jgi:D-sedoheptulose 7-phosphate isomerase
MSDFLYPFLSGEAVDRGALLEDLAQSAREKASESAALRDRTLTDVAGDLRSAAMAMVERFGNGGRLLAFGNGGSSTDAAGLASLFAHPPSGVGWPARTLADDPAVLSALGNDVGYDLVFSRQLIALGRPDDIAVGLSTSGNSPNLVGALAEAKRRGMLTVGFAGYDGGAMAHCDAIDHLFVVRSDSVHRIQETQDALAHQLWRAVTEHARAA